MTGNPSISFFKSLYKRYTSFAIESIETTFSGSVGFGKRVTVTIPRNGDLLHHLFLEITMTKHASNASFHPAEQFVKEVELEIGGQRVDKLYSDWFRIFSELYHSADEKAAYRKMTDFDNNAGGGDVGVSKRFYLPICFFFTRSPALALPLVALQCTSRTPKLVTPTHIPHTPTLTHLPLVHNNHRSRGKADFNVRDCRHDVGERCRHHGRPDCPALR